MYSARNKDLLRMPLTITVFCATGAFPFLPVFSFPVREGLSFNRGLGDRVCIFPYVQQEDGIIFSY